LPIARSHGGLRWLGAKSVNGRGLDFRFRAPMGMRFEVGAHSCRQRLKRGSPGCFDGCHRRVPGVSLRRGRVADAVRIAKRVADETGLAPAQMTGFSL
jgi:uncharacterized protein YicC (UPF0701 family)